MKTTLVKHCRRGFTLVEVLITMGILSTLMIGVFSVYMQSQKSLFVSTQKGNINRDIRQFTGELTTIARDANHFYIYSSIAVTDRNEITDRRVRGQTGDLLVLVFLRPHPGPTDPVYITRIAGYFRAAGSGERGPIRKFDMRYATADYKPATTTTVESLIPSVSALLASPQVVELADGMADGRLFLNYEDRSIMIKGQIHHGNDYKRLTDTYNFTITPRG